MNGKPKRQHIVVLIVYALAAIAMTWPVAAHLGTHLPGGGDDVWVHQWTFWWVKESIAKGYNPLYTHLLFYPEGVSLATHNFAWLNIAAWLPLQAVVGGNAAYSLLFIATFALNGFSMYLLARELTGSPHAAFVGGLIYGFWPYTLSHYGHPNMMLTCWVPPALLYLHRTIEERRARDALRAALFLALTGITRWQLLVMGSVSVLLYLACRCLADRGCRTWRTLGLLALTGLAAGALMAPLLIPVVSAYLTQPSAEDALTDDSLVGQTDLLAYVLPSRNHPLWSDAAARVYDNFVDNKVYVAFAGYTTLALALWGSVRRWKQARLWLLAAAVYVLLALGPQLRINGQLYPQVQMPYRLVGDLWFVQLLRKPDRFNIFLGLPLGMLASWGVAALSPRRSRLRLSLLAGALGLLILREYALAPYPTAQPAVPAWYGQLAQEPGDFAVLDLPLDTRSFDKHYGFYQTIHGKPLVEGHVSRPPQEAFTFIEGDPLVSAFAQEKWFRAWPEKIINLEPLAATGIRYIVVHKQFLTPDRAADWMYALATRPVYEDAEIAVFATRPEAGVHFGITRDFDGLLLAQSSVGAGGAVPPFLLETQWWSPERQTVTVSMRSASRGDVPFHTQTLAVEEGFSVVRVQLTPPYPMPVDEYELLIEANGESSALPQRLIPASNRWFAARLRPDATWADAIALRGVDWQRLANTLYVNLQWETLQAVEADYKFFVHLLDKDGALVAQYDGMPGNWAHPTSRWDAGDWFSDQAPVDLRGVPAGAYRLAIGWYAPDSGQRLAGLDAAGGPLPDDRLLLDSPVTLP
ncbi:MAG: glycosyltransferase family 39 protein [Anaerolineae bacterium]|nr:glycosyltransferase family 39 protein [Anaerolineae bacterium]